MPRPGRRLGPDGEIVLSEGQERFLDWLTGGRPEGQTQEQFAAELGVGYSTLGKWKRDRAFLKRWEERMRETWAHPDLLSKQLSKLNEKALAGDVKATELYWRLVDKMSPDRVEVNVGQEVEGLTDEQLDALIEGQALAERERRHLRVVE